MTVGELIAILAELPEDLPVQAWKNFDGSAQRSDIREVSRMIDGTVLIEA
jgi:hypothetical protein